MLRLTLISTLLLALPAPLLAMEEQSPTPTTAETKPAEPQSTMGKHMMTTMSDMAQGNSPALAAALSLQPCPADFGNFYVGNPRLAIASTTVQLALMGSVMVIVAENSTSMMRRNWDTEDLKSEWSRGERYSVYGLVGGYVLTKLASAWFAVDTIETRRTHNNVAVVPEVGDGRAGVVVAVTLP